MWCRPTPVSSLFRAVTKLTHSAAPLPTWAALGNQGFSAGATDTARIRATAFFRHS